MHTKSAAFNLSDVKKSMELGILKWKEPHYTCWRMVRTKYEGEYSVIIGSTVLKDQVLTVS